MSDAEFDAFVLQAMPREILLESVAAMAAENARLAAERDAYRAVAAKLISANRDSGLSYHATYAAFDLACAVENTVLLEPGATPAMIRRAAGLEPESADEPDAAPATPGRGGTP